MREYELKLSKIAGLMESHIIDARILSLKDIKANDVLDSDIEDLLSDEMWEKLECGRDLYYFDMMIFSKELYFIILDEFLFIKCGEMSFEVDGIFEEQTYNMFRDIVFLNSKCKTIKDII